MRCFVICVVRMQLDKLKYSSSNLDKRWRMWHKANNKMLRHKTVIVTSISLTLSNTISVTQFAKGKLYNCPWKELRVTKQCKHFLQINQFLMTFILELKQKCSLFSCKKHLKFLINYIHYRNRNFSNG